MENINLDFEYPEIFSSEIILSGVTKVNRNLFNGIGLTFSESRNISRETLEYHTSAFCEYLKIKKENLKQLKQIHSDLIFQSEQIINIGQEGDAIISSLKNEMIIVKLADCGGVLFFDPIQKIIAAVHSGWKGTQKNIVGKTITKMINIYGSNPQNILCYVSPLASQKNYEVGNEFIKYFDKKYLIEKSNKIFFDNRLAIYDQLITNGIFHSNIEVSDICTIEDVNFHSYRRDGINSGRMAAFIMMK